MNIVQKWNELLQAPKKELEYDCHSCGERTPDSKLRDIVIRVRGQWEDFLICTKCEPEFWRNREWDR